MKLNEKQFNYLAGFLIALAAFLVYSNTFNVPLQFDDIYHVQHKRQIRHLDNFSKIKAWTNVGTRPVAMFTMALNYHWGEENVKGYHIINFIFHIITGWLVYLLTKQILSLNGIKTKEWLIRNKNVFSFLVALLFVVHPMQTQAVTYIIQRFTIMAALFYLLCVLMYIKGRVSHIEEGFGGKTIMYYSLTLIALILGVLSKQIAVTLPITLIMTELLLIRDKNGNLQKKFAYTLSGLVASGIIIGLLVVGLPRETEDVSREVYLVTSLKVMVKYIQMMIVPIGQNLDHDIKASESIFGLKELVSLGILLGLIYLGYYMIKRDKLVSYGIFWFFITLSVESTIIPIRDFMFEHRMYLPSFGFFLAAATGLSYIPSSVSLGKQKVPAMVLLVALFILITAIAAYARNTVWQTSMSLWSDSVKKSPGKARPWMWQGIAYSDEKDYQNAKKCFDKSIELMPEFSMGYFNRGNVYKELNEYQKAIEDYTKAIKYKKDYDMAYFNRGVVESKIGKKKEAILDYDNAIKYNPDNALAFYNRGNAYRVLKKYDEALSDYNNAIELNPKYSLAIFNRGLTKAAQKNHREAIADFDRAISLDPRNQLFYNGKGVSQNSLKMFNEAIASYSTAISLNANFGQAYYNRGYTKYYGLRDLEGACQDWQMASQYNYKQAQRMLDNVCGNIKSMKTLPAASEQQLSSETISEENE